jgi:hypothetical protein
MSATSPVHRPQPVRVLDRDRAPGRLLRRADPTPALARRQPQGQPRHPHRRRQPDPPRHPRPGLLPAQARRGQDPAGSTALPQKAHLRRPVPTTPSRRTHGRDNRCERGSGRAPRGVSCIQRGRLTPAHRHFGSATSRTRTNDATRVHTDTEDHDPQTPRTRLLTTEGSRRDAGSAVRLLMCPLVAATGVDPELSPRTERLRQASGQRPPPGPAPQWPRGASDLWDGHATADAGCLAVDRCIAVGTDQSTDPTVGPCS